jgi:hypothetical protein
MSVHIEAPAITGLGLGRNPAALRVIGLGAGVGAGAGAGAGAGLAQAPMNDSTANIRTRQMLPISATDFLSFTVHLLSLIFALIQT